MTPAQLIAIFIILMALYLIGRFCDNWPKGGAA